GYSRDHRPDCEQMVIALIVNSEGFPFSYETFDGNGADVAKVNGVQPLALPISSQRRRPVAGKYRSSRSASRFRVFGGNAVGLVITAFARRCPHAHVRGGASVGSAPRRTSFAVLTFFRRFCTTASTETASCVSCQTS